LAHYYIYNGLGYEALFILNQLDKLNLPETQNDYFHALAGIANFLSRRWKEAVNHFSYGNIPNTTEGIFWKTIAKSAYQFEEGNNAIILTHISIIKDYPQIIKDTIAIIATKNAIAANDDLSAQNFIDIMKSVNFRFNRIEPQISYLLGQKLEMQGYLRNAIKEYQSLLNSNLTMFSAYGRLQHTILNQMVNFIDIKKAISELEKLRFAWGEREFQIKLLSKLADFYFKDKDYYNALRVLNEEGFIVDNDKKITISQKMIKIFEDVFIGNHADEILSPIKTLSLFEDFNWLVDLSVHRNTILQKLADRLVAIDLLPRAKNILLDLTMRDDLTPDDMGRIGARLAVIYLFEKNPEQAIDILDATASPQTSSEIMALRRIVRSQALST
jgi:tetratricopeptide (TPR) repeat protein